MVVSINVIHRQVQAYHDVCMNELGKVVTEETNQLERTKFRRIFHQNIYRKKR